MDRIALTTNPLRPPQEGFLPALVAALEAEGKEVRMDVEASHAAGVTDGPGLSALAAWAEIVLVVGGDGSILRAVHRMMPVLRPVMGVNSGRLGFCRIPARMTRRALWRPSGRAITGFPSARCWMPWWCGRARR